MQKKTTFWALGAAAFLVLGCIVTVGFLQQRTSPRYEQRLGNGAKLTDQQILSRRRAAIGTVAVAGATTQ